MSASSTPVVLAERVTHAFGTTYALREVDLVVEPGELVVLAGRSGSGKSTLLHLVAGAGEPTGGTIRVLGRPAHEVRDWSQVALMPQRSAIAGELTVAENVLLPASLHRVDPREGLLPALGLDALADRPATDTSLGEQQRTALARTLVLGPALALLDEPTGHQDDEHVDLVLAAIGDAAGTGTAVLVATHDQRVVGRADRVVHLESGRVVDAVGH